MQITIEKIKLQYVLSGNIATTAMSSHELIYVDRGTYADLRVGDATNGGLPVVPQITELTELTGGLAATDKLLIADVSVMKQMKVSLLATYMQTYLTFDDYDGWDLLVNGTSRGRITSGENVNFAKGTGIDLAYVSTDNKTTFSVDIAAVGTELTSGLADSDKFLISDTSNSNTVKRMDASVLKAYIDPQVYTAGNAIYISPANAISLNISAVDSAEPVGADYFIFFDYSEGGHKKIDTTDLIDFVATHSDLNQLRDVDTTGWTEGSILQFDSAGDLVVGNQEYFTDFYDNVPSGAINFLVSPESQVRVHARVSVSIYSSLIRYFATETVYISFFVSNGTVLFQEVDLVNTSEDLAASPDISVNVVYSSSNTYFRVVFSNLSTSLDYKAQARVDYFLKVFE